MMTGADDDQEDCAAGVCNGKIVALEGEIRAVAAKVDAVDAEFSAHTKKPQSPSPEYFFVFSTLAFLVQCLP